MRQPNDEEGARASDVSRIFGLGLGIPAPAQVMSAKERLCLNQLSHSWDKILI